MTSHMTVVVAAGRGITAPAQGRRSLPGGMFTFRRGAAQRSLTGEVLMTPAEVIAMRDDLSAVIEESRLTEPVEIADMLIGSGWVTSEPGRK